MLAFMLIFNVLILLLVGLVVWEIRIGARMMWDRGGFQRALIVVLALTTIPAMGLAYYTMWSSTVSVWRAP